MAGIKKIPFIFCLLLVGFGCGHPEIVIHSPTADQSFITEAYIYIDATITDDEGIKKVTWKIYNNEYVINLDTLMPTTYELHESASMYNLSGGSTKVIVSAEDNNGNTSSKEVTIHHTY